VEDRSRLCRADLRPPVPLSPEEEIRGRSGVRIARHITDVSEPAIRHARSSESSFVRGRANLVRAGNVTAFRQPPDTL
jgi:hypothetical protein